MKSVLSFIFFFCYIFTYGQDVWTIEHALQHAEEHSFAIIQARHQILQADIDYRAAKQQRIPSLSASSNYNFNYGRTIDPTTNNFTGESNTSQTAGLNAGLQLFSGGRIHKQIKNAGLSREVAILDKDATLQDIQLRVVESFFNVLFSKENVTIAESNLTLLEEQRQRTAKQVDAGAMPQNELLEIEAETASAEQRLISAENQLELASLQFKQLLRLPADEEVALAYPDLDEESMKNWEVMPREELVAKGLKISPQIQAAQLQMDRADLNIGMAKSRYSPTIGLGGSFNTNFSSVRRNSVLTGTQINEQQAFINGEAFTVGLESPVYQFNSIPYLDQLNENWGLGLGVSLSIPIYSQGQLKAGVERAKINYEDAVNYKEEVTQVQRQRYEQTLLDMRSAHRSYMAALKSVEASTRFFENISMSYSLGASNNFELINAQNRKEQAELNLIISKFEYLARRKSLGIFIKE